MRSFQEGIWNLWNGPHLPFFVIPRLEELVSNLSLALKATRQAFRFAEPVTVEVNVNNHSPDELPIGRLSPAYGNIKFSIRKPSGEIVNYAPPLHKCELNKEGIASQSHKRHVTSLAVDANGMLFDAPGRYEITAAMPDPSSGTLLVARPTSLWIQYPDPTDEDIAKQVFDRESGLFLYMAGGEHLVKGKNAIMEVVDKYPNHPFSAHGNLVLGLNLLSGQKSRCDRSIDPIQATRGAPLSPEGITI